MLALVISCVLGTLAQVPQGGIRVRGDAGANLPTGSTSNDRGSRVSFPEPFDLWEMQPRDATSVYNAGISSHVHLGIWLQRDSVYCVVRPRHAAAMLREGAGCEMEGREEEDAERGALAGEDDAVDQAPLDAALLGGGGVEGVAGGGSGGAGAIAPHVGGESGVGGVVVGTDGGGGGTADAVGCVCWRQQQRLATMVWIPLRIWSSSAACCRGSVGS